MSNAVIQPSFSAGELAPHMHARVDLAAYHNGVALSDNFFVDYKGGLSNRPGTKFVSRAWISSTAVRLVPFQFSTIQTYILEFGDLYMRVIKDGALVLEPSKSITAISVSSPGQFTVNAHGFAINDEVYLAGITGMTSLNQLFGIVSSVTANTFTLTDLDGVPINTIAIGTYGGGGTVSRVFRMATPYAAADLALLKFTQSADTMTITHPSYDKRDLTRTSHYQWTLTVISIGSSIAAPTGLVGAASAAGNASYAYVVTAVDTSGNESVASARANVINAVAIMNTAGSIQLNWNPVVGAQYYNVYKAQPSPAPAGLVLPAGANYGYMGSYTTNSALDTNIIPDFTLTPPLHTDPFAGTNYPSCSQYFQQRLCFAATSTSPQTVWMSVTGSFHNFDVRNPVSADDAVTANLVSKQVNNIKFMIGMPGGLICLTGGNAFQISGGGQNEPVTPSSVVAVPQAYNGCADVEPIVINDDILYVQAKGTVVRDLSYDFYRNIYTGVDISLLSSHLFENITIKEWAYQEEPYKLIWATRSDGIMLSLTFLKEQKVNGWAQHHTLGLFESVATIQEGNTNVVYLVVKRYLQGRWLRMIERMASRQMPYGVEDAWFLDCALQNDLTYPAAGLTADVATGTATFVADANVFAPGDIGKILRMDRGIATITTYVAANTIKGVWTREPLDILEQDTTVYSTTVAPMPLPVTQGNWSLTAPITHISGLGHLEGQIVSILGDGSTLPQQTVVNGSITISNACSKIVVGLPYAAKIQTLPLDVGEPTIQGKRKKISALTVRVTDTRGLKMGISFDNMTEFKMRSSQPMGTPIELDSGDQRVVMPQNWTKPGQFCVRQDYPLPASVLGVIPEIEVGDK